MEITITIKDDPRGGARLHVDYGQAEDHRHDTPAFRLATMVTTLLQKAGAIPNPLNLKPTKESSP